MYVSVRYRYICGRHDLAVTYENLWAGGVTGNTLFWGTDGKRFKRF